MPIIPLTCPCCGGNISIESDLDAAVCRFCGKPFIVKDAIVQNYITNVTNISADTINIFAQKDFVIEGGVLKAYKGESVHVTIPDTVRKIGDGAFAELAIESVSIPDCVTGIGDKAFFRCTGLTDIEIPNRVTSIGDEAFACCTGLVNIEIPNGTARIGKAAFEGCSGLTRVTIPDSVTDIGDDAFKGCANADKVSCDPRWWPKFERSSPFYQRLLRRKKSGLCAYCGGSFRILTGKCARCGKKKNY